MIAPLNAIMLGGLKVELDPGNLQAFLWVASVYANASIEYNTTFCDGLIRAILQKIVTVGTVTSLPPQITDVLVKLSLLCPFRKLQASLAGRTR